jgi:hypothetical protein
MTPTVDGLMLAQTVLVNQLTGNPTFVEVFSEFRPPRLPFPVFFFVIVILRDVSEPEPLKLTVWQGEHQLWCGDMTIFPADARDPVIHAAIGAGPVALGDEEVVVITANLQGKDVLSRTYPVVSSHTSATAPIPADI